MIFLSLAISGTFMIQSRYQNNKGIPSGYTRKQAILYSPMNEKSGGHDMRKSIIMTPNELWQLKACRLWSDAMG